MDLSSSIIAFILLFVGIAVGTTIGMVICASVDLGDFSFTDLRSDITKCVVIAAITAVVAVVLFQFGRNPRVFLPVPVVWFLGIKLAWLEIHSVEVFVAGISCFVFLGLVAAAGLMLLS